MLKTKNIIAALIILAMPSYALLAHKPAAQTQKIIPNILYGSKLSPFVSKVYIAMAEKKLSEKSLNLRVVETFPASILKAKGMPVDPEFQKASPLGKIPAFQIGSWTIADSSVIIAYLDRAYPKIRLYPVNNRDFAQTLWFEKYADERIADIIHRKIYFEKMVKPKLLQKAANEEVVVEAVNKELPLILDYLEQQLVNKKWIVGANFTAADIAIGVHMLTLEKCQIALVAEKYPNLIRYVKQIKARPSFKQSL